MSSTDLLAHPGPVRHVLATSGLAVRDSFARAKVPRRPFTSPMRMKIVNTPIPVPLATETTTFNRNSSAATTAAVRHLDQIPTPQSA
jgi:hypothetical protein